MKEMFYGEAVCRSELGTHQMQEDGREISEITWMGDIYRFRQMAVGPSVHPTLYAD